MGVVSTMELTEVLNRTVTAVTFDYAVSFTFDAASHLRIEGVFSLQLPGAPTEISVAPDQPGEAASGLTALHNTLLTQASCTDAGTLRISFSNGASITVAPSPPYEAWTFTTPLQSLVCLPSGGLAIWSKQEDG